MWGIFEPVPLYDEVAHTLTPFVLVALTAEIIYRSGGDDVFFDTPRHAILTGVVIGLVGAIAWEGVEILLDYMGVQVSHAPVDTGVDVLLGVLGGAAGAYVADRYLDRLFGVSRYDAQVPGPAPPRAPRPVEINTAAQGLATGSRLVAVEPG